MTGTISAPRIDERPEQPTLGIRVQTPMKGLSQAADKLLKELQRWLAANHVRPAGPFFRRYYVIDMQDIMDIEVGCITGAPLPGDARVQPGGLPAGRYASLVYTGSGLKGNKALLDWAHTNGLQWDRWKEPGGDAFRCRYESYLTDPQSQPRKTLWEIEVTIKLL